MRLNHVTNTTLQIAQIVPFTEAEGPGKRFALWFQGCPLRCPGCCNPEFIPFEGGDARTLESVLAELDQARAQYEIEGITLLGGEPLAHAEHSAALAKAAWERGLTVMVFSGHTLAEAKAKNDPHINEVLAHTDILVDGPYMREQPDSSRRWIGSTNQQIHFLTPRYRADDPCWQQKNTLEIRVRGNELTVNGFPALQAVGLWKKPKVK
jgi:anaerobic ribonucleoside-triphosphate reductase activating protein